MPELISELANLHVIALQKILGHDEDLVLLTEVDSSSPMDLWLLVPSLHGRYPLPTYLVTDSQVGEFTKCREFSNILDAKGFYLEVRKVGSWLEYERDEDRRYAAKAAETRAINKSLDDYYKSGLPVLKKEKRK